MYLIYRDGKTGKIREHIGGQKPRELSEEEVSNGICAVIAIIFGRKSIFVV